MLGWGEISHSEMERFLLIQRDDQFVWRVFCPVSSLYCRISAFGEALLQKPHLWLVFQKGRVIVKQLPHSKIITIMSIMILIINKKCYCQIN